MEKISVVIATYNGEKYIEDQLLSIVNQSVLPNEIVISDDCSMDSTLSIINKIKNETDITIKVCINNENLGYIKNFKKAIAKSSGEYIFLCDQDDIWKSTKIEETINILREYKYDVACTGFELIDSKGELIKNLEIFKSEPIFGYENWTNEVYDVTLDKIIWGNFNPGCTYCFKSNIKEIFEQTGNDEISHDYQILLIGANNGKALYIDKPLSEYRLHDNNAIGMNKKEKKRKRHFQPRVSRFFSNLKSVEKVNNLLISNIILYLRLPKIRSVIIHKFRVNNRLILRKRKL